MPTAAPPCHHHGGRPFTSRFRSCADPGSVLGLIQTHVQTHLDLFYTENSAFRHSSSGVIGLVHYVKIDK